MKISELNLDILAENDGFVVGVIRVEDGHSMAFGEVISSGALLVIKRQDNEIRSILNLGDYEILVNDLFGKCDNVPPEHYFMTNLVQALTITYDVMADRAKK